MDNKELLEEKIKPFDWTFTTDYMGTMSGFQPVDTDDRIDMEKLKKKDKILFYVDLTLFEDELHDNGIASLSIKMVKGFCYFENINIHDFCNQYSSEGHAWEFLHPSPLLLENRQRHAENKRHSHTPRVRQEFFAQRIHQQRIQG